jgi:RNA polymerase sigma factor (TIGR02999 family)
VEEPLTLEPSGDVTRLLAAWREGDESALARLLPLVEADLRRRARRYMGGENRGHTLQTTALVNEAFLKLVRQRGVAWQNRSHFFAVAAQAMRRVLVDHAKTRRRRKRGGGAARVTFDEAAVVSPERSAEVLALDGALRKLEARDPRKARLVEMRYFAGLSVEETADALSVSVATVRRDWRFVRAWLRRELAASEAAP